MPNTWEWTYKGKHNKNLIRAKGMRTSPGVYPPTYIYDMEGPNKDYTIEAKKVPKSDAQTFIDECDNDAVAHSFTINDGTFLVGFVTSIDESSIPGEPLVDLSVTVYVV